MNSKDKGKGIQLAPEMSDLSIRDIPEEAGWEVFSKKSKNRSGPPTGPTGPGLIRPATPAGPNGLGLSRPGGSYGTPPHPRNGSGRGSNGSGRGYPNPSPVPNPWPATPDPRKKVLGRGGNPRPQLFPVQQTGQMGPPAMQAPRAQGRNWAAMVRPPGGQPQAPPELDVHIGYPPQDYSDPETDDESDIDDDDEDDDLADDSDDDLAEDYDSDYSRRSFGTRKKNKWFKGFFCEIDKLTVDEINGETRQWHCPACANGPGAIEWYRGLQPLMTHAKTKGATRVKLHRELASLLEEELRRRGTSVIPVGEQFGQWKGLRETTTDHQIAWPPMVVIMNTQLGQDDNDKFIGMGNQELLDYFRTYDAKKARHSYGPKGHRGLSLLIFESDAVGYLEAERLHKHFEKQGTDRESWQRNRRLFLPGGKRQLYGFLAEKQDLDEFNQHCQGKTRLKFEMKSYQEMVVGPMHQMKGDNQQLHWLQRKVVKQEQRSKVMEQSLDVVSKRLRDSVRSIALVRERTLKHHEETKEEMDYQEHFFNEQIDRVHKAIEEKEMDFEDLLQTERAKATSNENQELRKEEIERFKASQDKGVEEFEKEKDELIKIHEDKKMQLRRDYLSKKVELEKQLDASLTALMEKYKASTFHASSASSPTY